MVKDGAQPDYDDNKGRGTQGNSGSQVPAHAPPTHLQREVYLPESENRENGTKSEAQETLKSVKRFADWVVVFSGFDDGRYSRSGHNVVVSVDRNPQGDRADRCRYRRDAS